jgi:hypothetical protein
MWAGFHRLRKQLNAATSDAPAPEPPRTSAEVIPLRRAGDPRGSGGRQENKK